MFFNLQVCVLSLSFRPATHRLNWSRKGAEWEDWEEWEGGAVAGCFSSPEMSLKRHTDLRVLGVRALLFDLL